MSTTKRSAPKNLLHLSERHLQLVDSFLSPLLDIKAHLLKEADHRPVSGEDLGRKPEQALPLG